MTWNLVKHRDSFTFHLYKEKFVMSCLYLFLALS